MSFVNRFSVRRSICPTSPHQHCVTVVGALGFSRFLVYVRLPLADDSIMKHLLLVTLLVAPALLTGARFPRRSAAPEPCPADSTMEGNVLASVRALFF